MSSNDPLSGPTPKAIGSLAKKQSDVTRQGAQKLKFVPTLPQRRKKEEVKAEPTTSTVPTVSSTERGRGRGRGRGDGRSRSRGRGAAPPVLEMTASGPFAMGPALAGSTGRRSTPRSNFTASVPTALGANAALGVNLSRSAAPSLKKENNADAKGKGKAMEEEGEVYSDPDDGVEIIDMERIRDMDWMAPESLQKERQLKKFKKEEPSEGVAAGEVDLANALDLSESEEEEELEDIIEDFAAPTEIDTDPTLREERLYFFQFPQPFPTFLPKASESVADVEMGDATDKKVTFAPDVVLSVTPGTSRTSSAVPTELLTTEPLDGIIGELEVYRSGAVKLRLTNGILFDVSAGTQPSFLQQATYLDKEDKRLCVLGEVNKQFVVSPNVDTLLAAMEEADNRPVTIEGEENLIKIDG